MAFRPAIKLIRFLVQQRGCFGAVAFRPAIKPRKGFLASIASFGAVAFRPAIKLSPNMGALLRVLAQWHFDRLLNFSSIVFIKFEFWRSGISTGY